MRHGRATDRRNELGTHFNDSSMLGLSPDHKAGDIVKENYGSMSDFVSVCNFEFPVLDLLLIAHANELSGFCRLIGIDDGELVGNDTNREA